jgi:hypothetical protein
MWRIRYYSLCSVDMRHERICRLIEIDNARIRYYSVSPYVEPEAAVFGWYHFAAAADAVILHIAK